MAFYNEDIFTNHYGYGFPNPSFAEPMMESPAFANDSLLPTTMINPLFYNPFFISPLGIPIISKVVGKLRPDLLNCNQSNLNEVVKNDEFDDFLNERFKGDEPNESDDELDVCA